MNKGYAFGFLVVLLVVVLGFYVAYTGFTSSREALRAEPTSPVTTQVGLASPLPSSPAPTATNTPFVIPSPIPGITATLTAAVPTATSEPGAPATVPAPTEPPPTAPPATAEPPTQAPPPTSPPSNFQFRLESPPAADSGYPSCCYLYGTVRDANGVPLEGVQVQAFNEWNTLPPAATKGGGEAGQYNIPIGSDAVTWNLVVVDAAGNRISPQVPVQFDPNVANGYRINWQRTY
jgi:hypothetical protein